MTQPTPTPQGTPRVPDDLKRQATRAVNDLLLCKNVIGVSADELTECLWSALSMHVLLSDEEHTQLSTAQARASAAETALARAEVFELIEINQCDDNYQPLGLFLTMEDAIAVVEENGVGICLNDPEEWAGVEIHKRSIGLSDNGKTVWKRSWERDFSDDATERWKIIGPSAAERPDATSA